MTHASRSQGFTLFEVLLVLTLVSSIVVFLTDVISKTLDMRGRLGVMTEQAHEGQIITTWIQNCLGHIISDPEKFEGTSKSIKGVSLMTLTADPGVPYAFELKIDYDTKDDITTLLYESGDGEPPLRLFAWRGSEGGFKFSDEKDNTHDRWPPDLGEQAELPKLIQFEGRTAPRIGKGKPWSFDIPLMISPATGSAAQEAPKGEVTGSSGGLSESASGGGDDGDKESGSKDDGTSPSKEDQEDNTPPAKVSKERDEARKLSPQEALREFLKGRGFNVGGEDD